jgi:hypothetical protein
MTYRISTPWHSVPEVPRLGSLGGDFSFSMMVAAKAILLVIAALGHW